MSDPGAGRVSIEVTVETLVLRTGLILIHPNEPVPSSAPQIAAISLQPTDAMQCTGKLDLFIESLITVRIFIDKITSPY